MFILYFTSTCKELFFEKNVRILKQYKNNHKTIIQKKEEKEETRKWEGWWMGKERDDGNEGKMEEIQFEI